MKHTCKAILLDFITFIKCNIIDVCNLFSYIFPCTSLYSTPHTLRITHTHARTHTHTTKTNKKKRRFVQKLMQIMFGTRNILYSPKIYTYSPCLLFCVVSTYLCIIEYNCTSSFVIYTFFYTWEHIYIFICTYHHVLLYIYTYIYIGRCSVFFSLCFCRL